MFVSSQGSLNDISSVVRSAAKQAFYQLVRLWPEDGERVMERQAARSVRMLHQEWPSLVDRDGHFNCAVSRLLRRARTGILVLLIL